MVRTYSSRLRLDLPPESLFELVRSPRAFIPLWPFLVDYDSAANRVRLRLRRFGFTMTVDYDVKLLVDEERGTVIYRCTAPGKLFTVTVSVRSANGGSDVEIEASYSGDYERFSQPLLREFVEGLASRLRSLEAVKPTQPVAPGSLTDPTFVARAIVSGRVVVNETYNVSSPADAAQVVQRVAGLSKGKRLFVRITFNDSYARLLFVNGNPVDAVLEARGRVEQGLQVVEKLVEVLRGRVNVLAVEI